jgi:hypothetical protein
MDCSVGVTKFWTADEEQFDCCQMQEMFLHFKAFGLRLGLFQSLIELVQGFIPQG